MVAERSMLTASSLLGILLFSIHVADDIVRGISGGGLENLFGILIIVVWLSGTLLMPARRPGQVIVALGSLFALAMPILHMRGAGVGGEIARSPGALFYIWILYALGVTGSFGLLLSARAFRSRRHPTPPAARE